LILDRVFDVTHVTSVLCELFSLMTLHSLSSCEYVETHYIKHKDADASGNEQ